MITTISTTTNLNEVATNLAVNNDYKIVIGNPYATTTVEITWNNFGDALKTIKSFQKNETLLIDVVRNFLRKANFDELYSDLNNEEITQEEFDEELRTRSDKYTIQIKNIVNEEDAIIIAKLVNKIGYEIRDLSSDEVSEMFSVNEEQLTRFLMSKSSLYIAGK